jgi:hypothetical protein
MARGPTAGIEVDERSKRGDMNKMLCRKCAWPINVHIDGICPQGATPPQKRGRFVCLPDSLYQAAEKAGYDMHDFRCLIRMRRRDGSGLRHE